MSEENLQKVFCAQRHEYNQCQLKQWSQLLSRDMIDTTFFCWNIDVISFTSRIDDSIDALDLKKWSQNNFGFVKLRLSQTC